MQAIRVPFKFFVLVFLLFLISCKSSFYVQKVREANADAIVYVLPKSKILIDVEVTSTIRQKGIFADYTTLYFNTKNAILSNSAKYYISDISLKKIPVKDTACMYQIVSPENKNPLLLNLSKESFIAGINLNDVQAEIVNTEQDRKDNVDLKNANSDYADISLHSVREIQYDTIYKEIIEDTIITKVPVVVKKEVYKSKAKQAKETADVIFSLRDDRYALLTGENDGANFPDGMALEKMLKELSDLEQNYMSLFTGRETKFKRYYRFEYVPPDQNEADTTVLFYFSNRSGISADSRDVPVYLHFRPKTDYKPTQVGMEERKYGIYYRIPGKADLLLRLKGKELFKSELDIPQIGSLNLIPGKLFDSKVTVEFYPDLGSLKRISE